MFSVFDSLGRLKSIGATGSTGPTGAAGANGVTGPPGPIGLGLDGEQGEDGIIIPGLLSSPLAITPWTPVIGGSGGTSGQTYTSQVGFYVRIPLTVGSLVFISFRAALSNKGTITTNVEIQGLPFTASAANESFTIPMSWTTLNTAMVYLAGLIINSTAVISVRANTAASVNSGATITTTAIANTTVLGGQGFYLID